MFDTMANLFPKQGQQFALVVDENPQLVTTTPRKMYVIRNYSRTTDLYVGFDDTINEFSAFPILPGEVIYMNTSSDLYVTAGSQSSEHIDARIMIMS